jgi:CsoR family transcriptional regulator, copper-sensing transcriptional repressor
MPSLNLTARHYRGYFSNLPIAVCGEVVPLSNITAVFMGVASHTTRECIRYPKAFLTYLLTYPYGVYYNQSKQRHRHFALAYNQERGKTMKHKTTHKENLSGLRRAAGQIVGVQKMIEQGKYCIDIVIQINAAIHALYRITDKILAKHIEHCIADVLSGKSEIEKKKKIHEMMNVIKKMRKLS